MGKGDLILVIGGFMILSLFTLSINNSITQNQRTLFESESVANAISIAQKFIEEAEALRFDEDKSATIPSSFTSPARLGPDDNEYYPNFDDIDDFNNFTYVDRKSGNTLFTISIEVFYATPGRPDRVSTTKTYFKRMVVKIHSKLFEDLPENTLTLKKLFAYHYFYSE